MPSLVLESLGEGECTSRAYNLIRKINIQNNEKAGHHFTKYQAVSFSQFESDRSQGLSDGMVSQKRLKMI